MKNKENISKRDALEIAIENEINYNIENLVNDEWVEDEFKEKLRNLTELDMIDMVYEVINDEYIWGSFNELIQYIIKKKIGE